MTALANENRALLEVTGPQARQLLQGQCTADLQQLMAGHWTLGALATPKGRLYASFYCLCLGDEQFWLVLPSRQIDNMLARFRKYAAFFRADLTDVTDRWQMTVTMEGHTDSHSVSDDGNAVAIAVPGSRIRLGWRRSEAAEALPEDELLLLAQAEIQAGIAWITPELNEQYLPQSLAWDAMGGVSFHKGCYTGQEVIARLHYKGASKRRLAHVSGSGPGPTPGDRVVQADNDKPAGEIVRAFAEGSGWQGLAVLKWPTDRQQLPPLSVNGQPTEAQQPVN